MMRKQSYSFYNVFIANHINKTKEFDKKTARSRRVYNKMDSFSSCSSTERYSEIKDDLQINKAALFLDIDCEQTNYKK